MNYFAKSLRAWFLLACVTSVLNVRSQVISNHFFGQNAWMPDVIGDPNACTDPPCVLNGELHQQWQTVKDSKAALIRYGGNTTDKNMPTSAQYLQIIDSVRKNGMEPMLQVPFYKFRYSAQQAADIVRYINITMGRKVKYWVIGNEPDLSYSYTTAAQVAAYIRPFASAMKAVDPTILIVGPECAWYNQNIIDGLTAPNGPSDITGKDAAGRYYIDVLSFHRYPFNGSQTRSQVTSSLKSPGGFRDNVVALNARAAACNTAHGRTGATAIRTAVTEGNICWQNSSSDNLNGLGANSFIGGQFVAEMLGIGMKQGLDFMNIWSVVEGNSTALNIGYLDPSGKKKPSYYHFQMLAENFKGIFSDGTSNHANVRTFGCRDSQEVCVMILNEDMASQHYTVRLDKGQIIVTNPVLLNIDAGIPQEYGDVIAGQSSLLLTFDLTGAITQKCEYSLNVQAAANQPPNCTKYATVTTVTEASPADTGKLEVNVFPNPTMGQVTIQLDKQDMEETAFELRIFNNLGQEVYKEKTIFSGNSKEFTLPDGMADGIYFLRLKKEEGDKAITRKIILQRK